MAYCRTDGESSAYIFKSFVDEKPVWICYILNCMFKTQTPGDMADQLIERGVKIPDRVIRRLRSEEAALHGQRN